MITIYRRHRDTCSLKGGPTFRFHVEGDLFVRKSATHDDEGRKLKTQCVCVLWVDGVLGGREIRESLNTCSWETACDVVRAKIAGTAGPTVGPVTVGEATTKYTADAEARQLSDQTVKKYKRLFERLKTFAALKGVRYLEDLTVDEVSEFRSGWKLGPRTSVKELERLRAFFDFARDREWVRKNPAAELKAPKVKIRPTLPFTSEEMIRSLAAIDVYAQTAGRPNAQRLRAFVLLLRYSGLRIGDAVQCGADRIEGNRLFLYTQKTGVPVYCVLPDFVVKALDAAPKKSDRFYFWTGASKLHSIVGKWQRRLQRLFELAKVSGGHAHRFRDTFAVELLLAGVPIERVSVLLGHQSIRVTERHYMPWTRSRQEQLEADLTRAWSQDPIVLSEKGTNQVHATRSRYN